jgi:H+/Cl- antiporter ClcA
MTAVLWIVWIITIALGIGAEIWRGHYSGNSDMVRSSSQFWFYIFLALSVLLTVLKLTVR